MFTPTRSPSCRTVRLAGSLIAVVSILPLPGLAGDGPEVANRESASAPASTEGSRPQRNQEFETTVFNSGTFAEEAAQAGMTVSREEVQRRTESYRKLYPDQLMDPSRVERILLAEKYIEANGLGSGSKDLDAAHEAKLDPAKFSTPEELETARKALRSESLLRQDETKREADRLEDVAQIRRTEACVPMAMWAASDLQVEGDRAECLAWNGGDCFVALREYNAAATQFLIPASMPLDSARAEVLRRYLLAKRASLRAGELGVTAKPDSLMRVYKMQRGGIRWFQSAAMYGRPVSDINILHALYGKYYAQFFAPDEDLAFNIIGSSDSAYVDSLHNVFTAWDVARRKRPFPDRGRDSAREPDLPWTTLKPDDLPGELATVADSLRVGQCSAPSRSKQGFFIVRLAKAVPVKEIPFPDAYAHLVYLATREKFLDMDSIVEAKAKKYYAGHKAEFARPDTMQLVSWLIPKRAPARVAEPRGKSTSPITRDTAGFRTMALSSLVLPQDVRMRLQDSARKEIRKGFYGPIANEFGRWYFRVRTRKASHDTLAYRAVRREIIQRISAPKREEGSGIAAEADLDDAMRILGVAQACKHQELKTRREKGDFGGGGLPNFRFPVLPPGLSEAERAVIIDSAKTRFEEALAKQRADEDEILRTARVDLTRLSK